MIIRDTLGDIGHDYTDETACYGAQCFGHLLQRHEALTDKAFCDRIAEHYDSHNPRTAAIIRAITGEIPAPFEETYIGI
jgi:hypothetical protein